MSDTGNRIQLSTYIEFLWAAALTYRVKSEFDDRGGIMIVAPPASLKTAILAAVENSQFGIVGMSDITLKTLVEMRDQIASKKVHSLFFYDFQKVFERKVDTSANIIGSLRALMCEGFTTASWEKQGLLTAKARALIIAATTPGMYRDHMEEWDKSGFSRRFIFSMYSLSNPDVVTNAIMKNQPVAMCGISNVNVPYNLSIPIGGKPGDEHDLRKLLQRGQRGEEIPLILLRKVLAVLRWKSRARKEKDFAIDVVREFGKSMKDGGAEIVL